MKKSLKIVLIVAACLVGAGMLITAGAVGALIASGRGAEGLNTVKFDKNTYRVTESFTSISVNAVECDVKLIPSKDGECKVVCHEMDKVSHEVEVSDGTLSIKRIDTRKWYDSIGIYFDGRLEISVYLPKSELDNINIKTASGDVDISNKFSFNAAKIETSSGEVNFSAPVAKTLDIKTSSGDIEVYGSSPEKMSLESISGEIEVSGCSGKGSIVGEATSGDISFKNITAGSVYAKTTSGEVEYENVISSSMKIESVSGEIELERCDADSITLKSKSGDISGTLLTDKSFTTKSVSGNINVPSTNSDSECDVRTTSGNIYIRIAK